MCLEQGNDYNVPSYGLVSVEGMENTHADGYTHAVLDENTKHPCPNTRSQSHIYSDVPFVSFPTRIPPGPAPQRYDWLRVQTQAPSERTPRQSERGICGAAVRSANPRASWSDSPEYGCEKMRPTASGLPCLLQKRFGTTKSHRLQTDPSPHLLGVKHGQGRAGRGGPPEGRLSL